MLLKFNILHNKYGGLAIIYKLCVDSLTGYLLDLLHFLHFGVESFNCVLILACRGIFSVTLHENTDILLEFKHIIVSNSIR